MTKRNKLRVTVNVIAEAYVYILDKHLQKGGSREFRMLRDEDFEEIPKLRRELGALRAKKREEEPNVKFDYKAWRDEMLDSFMKQGNWSPETRNLFASLLSVLHVWTTNGRDKATEDRLALLMPGARVFLQHLRSYQLQML